MKKILILLSIFVSLILLIPCLALGAAMPPKTGGNREPSSSTLSGVSEVVLSTLPQASADTPNASALQAVDSLYQTLHTAATGYAQKIAPSAAPVFRILDESTGQVLTVPDREFLYGAIVTEMPPTYEPEALKAQAVAAYTYYSNQREKQKKNPTASLKGADFSADTKAWRIYTTKEEMQARWGAQFDSYYQTLSKVVDEVSGKTLQYEGSLITATYYAISSGKTENAKDVWGGDYAYLVSVSSPGDASANGYQTTVSFSPEEFQAKALEKFPSCQFPKETPDQWISNVRRTDAGSVSKLEIGGVEATGMEIRNAFGLRSANFTCDYQDGKFVFTVKGYGHGVGMSQVGAQYMAQNGSTYEEILAWYYPKTQLVG